MAVIEKEHTITVSKHPKACGTIIYYLNWQWQRQLGGVEEEDKYNLSSNYHLAILVIDIILIYIYYLTITQPYYYLTLSATPPLSCCCVSLWCNQLCGVVGLFSPQEIAI